MKRAFTYVELVVVIAILFIVTAIVMPRLSAMRKGREVREFKTAIRDLASRARSRAIDSGDVVTLRFDKSGGKLMAVERNSQGAELPVQQLVPPADVTPSKFVADQNANEGDDWQVPFYADGTSAGGGLEFEAGDRRFSFVVNPSDAQSRIVEGLMPDLSLDRWQAGSYAKRTK
jgi:type II secretory pathway pseudopilin PulG